MLQRPADGAGGSASWGKEPQIRIPPWWHTASIKDYLILWQSTNIIIICFPLWKEISSLDSWFGS